MQAIKLKHQAQASKTGFRESQDRRVRPIQAQTISAPTQTRKANLSPYKPIPQNPKKRARILNSSRNLLIFAHAEVYHRHGLLPF